MLVAREAVLGFKRLAVASVEGVLNGVVIDLQLIRLKHFHKVGRFEVTDLL